MTSIRSDLHNFIAIQASSIPTADLHHSIKAYIIETYPAVDYSKLQLEVINYKEHDDDRYYHLQELVFNEQEFELHYPELYI